MTTRTADRLDGWDARPFTEGYEELRALSDQSFSGVVTAGRATLCLLNGTAVGVLDGTIEDFENANGTIYKAPTPALPLLLLMQDRGDEVRAKYYSEETPLSEADQKLSDGGFTGYIELSENVLSGDYYVVYQGGKSMSVAFVGESEKLITGDEAFEKADEEVGIYKVRQVDIDVVEIPEPEEPDDDAPEAATTTGSESEQAAAGSTDDGEDTSTVTGTEQAADEPGQEADPDRQAEETQASATGEQRQGAQPADESEPPTDTQRTNQQHAESETARSSGGQQANTTEPKQSTVPDRDKSQPREDPGQQNTQRESNQTSRRKSRRGESGTDPQRQTQQRTEPVRESGERARRDSDRSGDRGARDRQPTGREGTRQPQHGGSQEPPRREEGPSHERDAGTEQAVSSPDSETTTEEPGELERRSIPSVDPDRSWTGDGSDSGAVASGFSQQREEATSERSQPRTRQDERTRQQSSERGRQQQGGRKQSGNRAGVAADLEEAETEITNLERRIDDLEAERDTLQAERDDLQTERDQLQAELTELESELQSVRGERDELEADVDDLRETVSALERRLDQAGEEAVTAETTLRPQEAIDGTNLFVRYESKGEATLKSAHDGSADAEEVNENLSLEYHTQFDSASTAVEGQTYDEFLVGTIHYRFVSWLIRKLLYEIRDTGHQGALADLYDALPRIDRVELNGTVTVEYTEDGEEKRDRETFDIVVRDRMGNPLAVANINDDRAAATEDMMTELVTAARRVGESNERLAGGFFVTSSFFDPDALDTAAEATGGGLLSRDKRQSFVKLSRKDGFHLCLVESRDGDFHLAVPEL